MSRKISVVTWGDSRGGEMKICQTCDAHLRQLKKWISNWAGQSYSVMVKGPHLGECGHEMHGKPFKSWAE